MAAVGAVAVFLLVPNIFAGQFSQITGVQTQETNLSANGTETQPVTTKNEDTVATVPVEVKEPTTTISPLPPFSPSTKPDIDRNELAMQVHDLVNEERLAAGLLKLDYDRRLANVAETHSQDMASRHYFEHVNPDGQDPSDRAEVAGYECMKDYGAYYTVGIAENLMQGWNHDSIRYVGGLSFYDWNTTEEIAKDTVEGWMGSKGHRDNILTADYDREGIGVAFGPEGEVYVTENFC